MDLNKFFKKATTVEEKAEAIIDYFHHVGLTPDQMLEVIGMVEDRLVADIYSEFAKTEEE